MPFRRPACIARHCLDDRCQIIIVIVVRGDFVTANPDGSCLGYQVDLDPVVTVAKRGDSADPGECRLTRRLYRAKLGAGSVRARFSQLLLAV